MNNKIKKLKPRRLNSHCEQELFDKLLADAKKNDATLSEIIRYALRLYLNNPKDKELPKE